MFTSLLVYFTVGALVSLLSSVALTILAWVLIEAISAIATLIRKIGRKIAVIRRANAMKKLLKIMAEEFKRAAQQEKERAEILKAINDLNVMCDNNGAAFLAPMDENGEEHWEEVKIIKAEDTSRSDMSDVTVVTEDARYRSITI